MNQKVLSALGNKYQFKIYNADSSDKLVALLAGPFTCLGATTTYASPTHTTTIHWHDTTNIRAAGYSVDAIADDGTIATSTTGTAINSTFKIREFREFIRQNPQTLKDLHIAGDATTVWAQQVQVLQWTPLTKAAETVLDLSMFFDQYQYQATKMVIPNINLLLNDQTVMIMNIPAGRTVTYSFIFE